MVKLKNYYKELPPRFEEDFCIDAKRFKVGLLLNLVALILAAVIIVSVIFLKFENFGQIISSEMMNGTIILPLLVLIACIFAYTIVHELTHGVFYKILTGQKLKFGITLSVAYCGLADGYVNKKTALIASAAPFVIHSIWLISLICVLPPNIWAFTISILFALHFGGCCGDLFVIILLLIKYRGKAVLVNDSGPCQTFYIEK